MKKRPLLVIVPDQDGKHEYDLFFVVPPRMSPILAGGIIDEAIRKVKAANPNEYTYSDLEKELAPEGFINPNYIITRERW